MQDTQGGQSACREAIYNAAYVELEKLQREIEFEKVSSQRTQRQKRLRQQTLLAGGVLLSSLMSAVTVQMVWSDTPRPLSQPEASALHNLVDYVAMRQAANDRWVARALCAHFGVGEIAELAGRDYDDAVFYLLKLAQN